MTAASVLITCVTVCGGTQFDDAKELCCGGEIHEKKLRWMCCGGEWISQDKFSCFYNLFSSGRKRPRKTREYCTFLVQLKMFLNIYTMVKIYIITMCA